MEPIELTILVVDDWPDAASTLGNVLALYGHAVHLAVDGEQALEMAAKLRPDVVLLDISMPKINGLEVAKTLSEQGDKKPFLIAISGYCTTEDKAAAYRAGFEQFFAKPIDLDALLITLQAQENYLFRSKKEKGPD